MDGASTTVTRVLERGGSMNAATMEASEERPLGSNDSRARGDTEVRAAYVRGWAIREMAPWRLRGINQDVAERFVQDMNAKHSWAAAYRFAHGEASLVPRPDGSARHAGHQSRAVLYLNFFQDVAKALPSDFRAMICLNLDDQQWHDFDYPIFCFQKRRGSLGPLVPDIDFLASNFYEGGSFIDTISYENKRQIAVFTGGTSGGLITETVARTLSLPRLRAANYFKDSKRVDFRLPSITQTASADVRSMLESLPFCRKPRMAWKEQLQAKFLLSIDGNGATCSRVVIALASNSVLLKYELRRGSLLLRRATALGALRTSCGGQRCRTDHGSRSPEPGTL